MLRAEVSSLPKLAALLSSAIAAEFPGGEYYNVVLATQVQVPIQTSSAFGFWTDGGFYFDTGAALSTATAPIPASPVYENMPTPNADHHFMVLEQLTWQDFDLMPLGTVLTDSSCTP